MILLTLKLFNQELNLKNFSVDRGFNKNKDGKNCTNVLSTLCKSFPFFFSG